MSQKYSINSNLDFQKSKIFGFKISELSLRASFLNKYLKSLPHIHHTHRKRAKFRALSN